MTPSSFFKVGVVPGVVSPWTPVLIKRLLINDDFNGRITDGAAKVVVSLNIDFDFFAEAESLLPAILFRGLHGNFKLRQFVLLETKQFGATNAVVPALVPKLNVVFAKW